jgi:hypothetical protein
MSVFAQLALAWQSFLYTFRQLFRGSLWAPFALQLAAEVAVIAALWWFAHPWLSWFMAPILERVGGAGALRYPSVFRLMPGLYGRVDFVIVALLGSVVIGAATALFAARFSGATVRAGDAISGAGRRAFALILANLPVNLLMLVLFYGIDAWLADRESSGRVRLMAHAGVLGLAVIVQAFFLYVTPLVVLERRSALAALAALPRAAARGIWAALLLGFLTLVLLLPIQQLAGLSDRLVARGTPELVGWLVVVQACVALLTSFLLAGSATLVFQSAVQEREGEGAR